MDLLVLLYEFQNPRLTAEVIASIRSIRLSNIRMTSLKCFILSSVLSCTSARYLKSLMTVLREKNFCCFFICVMVSSPSYHLDKMDLSSCLLTHQMLEILSPAFRHTKNLK